MNASAHPDITQILHCAGRGDRAAADRLLRFVYDNLRRVERALRAS